jgi:hypothetical protein
VKVSLYTFSNGYLNTRRCDIEKVKKMVETTDLKVKERNVVSDDFSQCSHHTHHDQQLGVGRTGNNEKGRPNIFKPAKICIIIGKQI